MAAPAWVGRDPLQAVSPGSDRLGSHTEPDDGPDLGLRRRRQWGWTGH